MDLLWCDGGGATFSSQLLVVAVTFITSASVSSDMSTSVSNYRCGVLLIFCRPLLLLVENNIRILPVAAHLLVSDTNGGPCTCGEKMKEQQHIDSNIMAGSFMFTLYIIVTLLVFDVVNTFCVFFFRLSFHQRN